MKQVATKTGEPIAGLFRDSHGALQVIDAAKLAKAQAEASHAKRIDKLESDISDLKNMLGQVLNMLSKDTSNG